MDLMTYLARAAERALLDGATLGGVRGRAYMAELIGQHRAAVRALGSASAAAGQLATDLARARARVTEVERRAQGAERALVTGIVDPPADHLWATTGQVEQDVAGVPTGRLYCATCTLKADAGVVLAAQCLGRPSWSPAAVPETMHFTFELDDIVRERGQDFRRYFLATWPSEDRRQHQADRKCWCGVDHR